VARFPGPILVIHGRDDRLIPWQQGRRLAAASTHSIFRLYDCGHGCWDPAHLPFWHDAVPFLEKAGILSSTQGKIRQPAGARSERRWQLVAQNDYSRQLRRG
jgi:hypothetical protein